MNTKIIDYSQALVDVDKSENVKDIYNAFIRAGLQVDFDNDEGLYTFYTENDTAALYMQSVAYLQSHIHEELDKFDA